MLRPSLPTRRNLWVLASVILSYSYGWDTAGVFVLSVGAILIIRGSGIRLTMKRRVQLAFLGVGLYFLGWLFIGMMLGDTLEPPSPGMNTFKAVMGLTGLGTWATALVTFLVGCLAKARRATP